jgi:hypothetical protein
LRKKGTVGKGLVASLLDTACNPQSNARTGGVIMATLALEKAQELEKQKQAVLQQGAEEALAKAITGFRELREIVTEQLKVIRAAQR